MTSEETVTMPRKEYDALMERNSSLRTCWPAQDADDGVRVPHEVALDIMRGEGSHPCVSEPPGHDPGGAVR